MSPKVAFQKETFQLEFLKAQIVRGQKVVDFLNSEDLFRSVSSISKEIYLKTKQFLFSIKTIVNHTSYSCRDYNSQTAQLAGCKSDVLKSFLIFCFKFFFDF